MKAAKTVFVNGQPNVWELAVQAVPGFLVPLVRLLSRTFPSKAGLAAEAAFATVYGTSDTLIEVGHGDAGHSSVALVLIQLFFWRI